MKQLIADLGSKATNSALGLVKGGNDINVLDNGELQLDTAYDSVDVNASANIANITKGGKFKTILGNIVAALTGINSSVVKLNSDFALIETTLSERGKILGYLAQVPDTDTVQKTYDLTPYSGVYIVLNFNGFTNSDYIPLTGLVTGTRVISVRPEEAYYCNAKYTFVKPSGSFQGTFRLVGTTKHNASVASTLTIYGVK